MVVAAAVMRYQGKSNFFVDNVNLRARTSTIVQEFCQTQEPPVRPINSSKSVLLPDRTMDGIQRSLIGKVSSIKAGITYNKLSLIKQIRVYEFMNRNFPS